MEPEIKNGDLLLIDQDSKDIYPGKIYLIAMAEVAVVRRIDVLPGRLILHCDNPQYPDHSLDQEDIERIRILGRVIWSGREHM